MRHNVIFIIVCLFLIEDSFAAKYHYREIEGVANSDIYVAVDPTATGYSMTFNSLQNKDTVETEKFETDTMFAVRRWQYTATKKKMKIEGTRQKNVIGLTGIFKGKAVNCKVRIDSLPWHQEFPFQLSKLLRENGFRKFSFWAIGTDDPVAFKAGKFTAKPKMASRESIEGRSYSTLRIRIDISGIMGCLWHSDAWFNLANTEFVKFNGKGCPFSSEITTTLISKEK